MGKMFRVTLWSGGKPAMVQYIKEPPKMADGFLAFRTEDGNVIRMAGNITVEEGEFSERPITGMRR